MLDEWLDERLVKRKEKGLYRNLQIADHALIDFTSNDYLGLARSEVLQERIRKATSVLSGPVRNGATGSRLLSGNSPATLEVERTLANIFQSQSTLLFNSGYTANLAVLSAIPQKGDTIIYDELAHASIKDGARLSLARRLSFRHNDLDDLVKKLMSTTGRNFVVVESIYSMDGDECPLEALVQLSKKHNFILILDEAHSTGVHGPRGAGFAVEKGLHNRIDIRIYTFGKGMGVCGACVAGSDALVRYLINFARPFIYTTAPSAYQSASIGCAFDFLNEHIQLQRELRQKVNVFLDSAGALGNLPLSQSAIQTCIIPGNENTKRVAQMLQQQGFDVRPILSPTVPDGKERLRICLHAFNRDEDIIALTDALRSLTESL